MKQQRHGGRNSNSPSHKKITVTWVRARHSECDLHLQMWSGFKSVYIFLWLLHLILLTTRLKNHWSIWECVRNSHFRQMRSTSPGGHRDGFMQCSNRYEERSRILLDRWHLLELKVSSLKLKTSLSHDFQLQDRDFFQCLKYGDSGDLGKGWGVVFKYLHSTIYILWFSNMITITRLRGLLWQKEKFPFFNLKLFHCIIIINYSVFFIIKALNSVNKSTFDCVPVHTSKKRMWPNFIHAWTSRSQPLVWYWLNKLLEKTSSFIGDMRWY